MVDVYMLDLIGTFVFAVSGANVGIQRKLNVLGVSVFAFLTAVGGGTVRCVLTHTTPFYFIDHHYIEVIIIGIVFALLTYPFFQYLHFPLLLIDALGVVTFAYIGAYKAESTHLGSFAVVLFAGLTAVGGGVVLDIVTGEKPQVVL